MYALDNVKKFVDENPKLVGDHGEEIMSRAWACSFKGLISGGSVSEIMQDDSLAEKFHQIMMSDSEHIFIGINAMRSADANTVVADIKPIDNFSKALGLIRLVNILFKEEWDKDPNNHLASASYKALNALQQAISEKIKSEEQDEDYVLSRLWESFSRFADHYQLSFEEALTISGYPIQKK